MATVRFNLSVRDFQLLEIASLPIQTPFGHRGEILHLDDENDKLLDSCLEYVVRQTVRIDCGQPTGQEIAKAWWLRRASVAKQLGHLDTGDMRAAAA